MPPLWARDEGTAHHQLRPGAADAANTAHDFGNVLQCATSALRVCERQLKDRGDVDLATLVNDAEEALARAAVLASRIAGLEGDRGPVQPLSVAAVILSMRRLLRQAVGDKILLETVVADALPPVLCDGLDLENAVLNLAINAREAMPQGGRLIIQVRPSRSDGLKMSAGVTISVSDTGFGMSQDVADRAFTRAFSTKGAGNGRGLGLTCVRQFACDAGGSADIDSIVGSGTTVRIHLPEADAA